MKNAVSLGVYASEANAKRRAATLRARGYTVVSAPHAKAVRAYAAIEAGIGGDAAALHEAWASRFPGQPLRQVDCD